MIEKRHLLVLGVIASLLGASDVIAAKKKEMMTWTPQELKWETPEGAPMSMVAIWGNPNKGPHFGLMKFEKGKDIALHTHSVDHYGVVVEGTFILADETGTEKTLGPGSALSVPALVKHTTKCGPATDCVLAGYVSGKDVTKMVKQPVPQN